MGVQLTISLPQPHARYASLLARCTTTPLRRHRRPRLSVRAGEQSTGAYGEWDGERLGFTNESRSPPDSRLSSCSGGNVDLPISLRLLQRKQQQLKKKKKKNENHGGLSPPPCPEEGRLNAMGNSLLNAFSSMVFMVRTLQNHSLRFRQNSLQHEIDGLLRQVHRDLHASFLWLFQQVFACTPQLMVLLMILLADYTASSMASNLFPSQKESPSPAPSQLLRALSGSSDAAATVQLRQRLAVRLPSSQHAPSPSAADDDSVAHGEGGWFGNGGLGGRGQSVAGGEDGGSPDRRQSAVYSAAASADLSSVVAPPPPPDPTTSSAGAASESSDALAFAQLSHGDAGSIDDERSTRTLAAGYMSDAGRGMLDEETMKSLVAPFSVSAEEDDRYACYGRTDLCYQYAISNDGDNAMLLANYAQFLFVVRKDYDRAEELFRRAVRCDPSDGSAAARFAAFLWIARGDAVAAEAAHLAAIRADPANSFNAANYAHFLWSSGQ